MMNYIYLVQSADKKHSVIIKYGEETPSSACIEGMKCSLERQSIEYNCLKLVDKFCPGYVPKPYVYDCNMHIIAMEYMEEAETLQDVLLREVDIHLAEDLGRRFGSFIFQAHRGVVSQDSWNEIETCLKSDSPNFLLGTRFDAIENYKGNDSLIVPLNEERFKEMQSEIAETNIFAKIKNIFLKKDGLMQFDAHNLSVLISKDRTVFIDFEFGGLGSHAKSLGEMLTSYYFALYDIRSKMADKKELQLKIEQSMRRMVNAFLNEFGDRVDVLGTQEEFIAEMAAIFGHFIFALAIYDCRPLFVHMTNEDALHMMEKGFQIMANYEDIKSLDSFMQTVFDK